MPTVTYVRWHDAVQSVQEFPIGEISDLIELQEIGFLKVETDESLSLSMEWAEDDSTARLWLTIPKTNIIERKDLPLESVLKVRRVRKT